MVSCGKKKSGISTVTVDAEEMPMVHTENITSLISDSGITRIRLNTKVWDIFQSDSASYWYFPEGIYIEQFDSLFNIEGSLKADTAYHYVTRSLWRVIGNVYIRNLQGLIFETSELFWDGKPVSPSYAIYTDKFVKVTTPEGRIVTGVGMHSDIQMNDYVFYQTGGVFEGYESSPNDTTIVGNDSVATDSINNRASLPSVNEEQVTGEDPEIQTTEDE